MKTRIFKGLRINIENEAGSTRSGVDVDGKPWKQVMTYPYGEIIGSTGIDGDPVDVFIGPDKAAKFVYIITTTHKEQGHFDENKCMLGFPDAMSAKAAFYRNYTQPELHYGDMAVLSFEDFKKKVMQTKKTPTLIRASKMNTAIELYAQDEGFKIGDPVTVDGMHGRGVVVKVEGRRVTVRFWNREYVSRDQLYVHSMNENNYKSKYSSLHANEGIPEEAGRGNDKWIEKVGTQFCIRTNGVDNNLGCWPSREKAEAVMAGKSFIEPDVNKSLKAGGPGSGRHKTTYGRYTVDEHPDEYKVKVFRDNKLISNEARYATKQLLRDHGIEHEFVRSDKKIDPEKLAKAKELYKKEYRESTKGIKHKSKLDDIDKIESAKGKDFSPVTKMRDKMTMKINQNTGEIKMPKVVKSGGPGSGKHPGNLGTDLERDIRRYNLKTNPHQHSLSDKIDPRILQDTDRSTSYGKVSVKEAMERAEQERNKIIVEAFNPKIKFKNPSPYRVPGEGKKASVGITTLKNPIKLGKPDPNPGVIGKIRADYGEPNAGAYQTAHLDTKLWFHPPSLKNPDHVPTDDPGEKDNRFGDVDKRKPQKQRMDILKRSAPGGNPPNVPVRTTLISPTLNSYMPMHASAVRRRRHGGGMFRAFNSAKI